MASCSPIEHGKSSVPKETESPPQTEAASYSSRQWIPIEGSEIVSSTSSVAGTMSTLFQRGTGLFKNLFPAGEGERHDPSIMRLRQPGTMLTGSILRNYIEKLQEVTSFQVIHNFYLLGSISDFTLEEVMETLSSQMESVDSPICIPVVIGGSGRLEQKHIVTIGIKDRAIEYYDPKGRLATYGSLSDRNTIQNVLEAINDKYYTGQGLIYQNTNTHQWDIHNCGVYSCYYIYETFTGGRKLGTEMLPPDSNIFRKVIYQVIS